MINSRIISKVTLDFLHFLHQNRPKWAVSQRQNCCKITKNRFFLNSPKLIFSGFCLTKMKKIVKKRGFQVQNGPEHPLVRSFRFWMAICSKSPNSAFFHMTNGRAGKSYIYVAFWGTTALLGAKNHLNFQNLPIFIEIKHNNQQNHL